MDSTKNILLIIISLIVGLILLILWGLNENISGSVYAGLIIWAPYSLYGTFWMLIIIRSKNKLKYFHKIFFYATLYPYVQVIVFCIGLLFPAFAIFLIFGFALWLLPIVLIIESLIIFILLIKYTKNSYYKFLAPQEIIIYVFSNFLLIGIAFSFLLGIDDIKERQRENSYSLKFDNKIENVGRVTPIDSVSVQFIEGSTGFSTSREAYKISNLIDRIIPNLKENILVTIQLDAYADYRSLAKPSKTYPSNYELTVERSNRVKNTIINNIYSKKLLNKTVGSLYDNIRFVENRYSSEKANHIIDSYDRRVDIRVFKELINIEHVYAPNWLDYLYFSFYTITTTGYGDIKPVSKFTKSIVTIENIIEVYIITILMGFAVSVLSQTEKEKKLLLPCVNLLRQLKMDIARIKKQVTQNE